MSFVTIAAATKSHLVISANNARVMFDVRHPVTISFALAARSYEKS